MESESVRRSRVAWALAITKDTSLAPGAYEVNLLDKYVSGIFTLVEVIVFLETKQQAVLHVEEM